MGRDARRWIATYRLQLGPGLDFDRAAARVPYLARLGISHLYLSPILQAARGSTHGYDVVDHEKISDALGGAEGFARLVRAVHAQGLGIVVDIVPNHMSTADRDNRWWWDVLESGPASVWAQAFDVDWHAPEDRYRGAVLVPVLGDHRRKLALAREIRVEREGSDFVVAYADRRFPVAPRALGGLVAGAARASGSDRLAFLGDALLDLPRATDPERASVDRRRRDLGVLRSLLTEELADEKTADAMDRAIGAINMSPDALDAFLDEQNYSLVYWRAARHDLDYRRFFDVDALVGLRMENEQVLEATHALLLRLVEEGSIDGLRIDHVDGLASPRAYLEAIRKRAPDALVVVEKILADGEELREAWPVDGTTGYELMADLTALSVEPSTSTFLSELDTELTGETRSFHEIATEARREVLDRVLPSDVHRLSRMLAELRDRHRDVRDHSSHDLEDALRELIAVFPIYRTYVEPERGPIDPEDTRAIEQAVAEAKVRRPSLEPELLDFIADLLLGRRRGVQEAAFVRRFQQLTPSAMAKGVEDTAFYRAPRFLAANEVGGHPERTSLDVDTFHARNVRAARRWPNRLLALSTHDTKRSADVRARLVAAVTDPERYRAVARRFFEHAERRRAGDAPELAMVSLALQTLIGAWPLTRERFARVLEKSAKEAKLRTSWLDPRAEYETQLRSFAEGVLADDRIRAEIDSFVLEIEPRARAISLAWTLLACTLPGVPDIYQGTEILSHTLVDPDNRRPIDFDVLEGALRTPLVALEKDWLGVTKQRVIQRALALRREQPDVFAPRSLYEPLAVQGVHADRALAFVRRSQTSEAVVVVAHRPPTGGSWSDTSIELPRGRFVSTLDDSPARSGRVALRELFASLPVALLAKEASA